MYARKKHIIKNERFMRAYIGGEHMKYEGLEKIFYQDKQRYEEIYQQRWNSEYAIHLDFEVAGYPAFFMQTPEIFAMLAQILRMNKAVSNLCQVLPGAAIYQFSRRCLIDEIVLTNSIEGVRSTRKEISDILDELDKKSKGKRFYGLVQKYNMLMSCQRTSSMFAFITVESLKDTVIHRRKISFIMITEQE